MATVADAKRRQTREPLITNGRYMTCPRCREHIDILRFIPMGMVEEFKEDTVPVYKCPQCRWIFAPALNIREEYEIHDRSR